MMNQDSETKQIKGIHCKLSSLQQTQQLW